MHREALYGKWEHEPIFPATGSMKSDGTHFAFFCHLLYDGEYTNTVRVEEIGNDAWVATIEDAEGDTVHRMGTQYESYQEAFDDSMGWATGQ